MGAQVWRPFATIRGKTPGYGIIGIAQALKKGGVVLFSWATVPYLTSSKRWLRMPKANDETPDACDALLKEMGVRIRNARLNLGLSQKQLGARAELAQSYIFEMEAGGSNLTIRTLSKMATILEVDMKDLIPDRAVSLPSPGGLALLLGALERTESLIQERQALEQRRLSQEAELLSELRAFTGMRRGIARALKLETVDLISGKDKKGNQDGKR